MHACLSRRPVPPLVPRRSNLSHSLFCIRICISMHACMHVWLYERMCVCVYVCMHECMYVYTYTHTYTSMSGGVPTLDGGTSPPCEEPVGSDLPFLSLATEGRFSEFRLSEKLPRFIDLGTSPFLTRFSFFCLQNDGSSSRAAAAGSASCTTHTYVRTAMCACMHACLLAYIQTYIQTDRPPRARHPAPHAPR